MNRYFGIILILTVLFSCSPEPQKPVDVSHIEAEVVVERFEHMFYETTEVTLPELKAKYPYLFPIQDPDSIWLQRISDFTELELLKRTDSILGDMQKEKSQIEDLFKRTIHYFPQFKPPKIITLISNRDYQSRVILTDSLLFVSLDLYLGKDDDMYFEFPSYLAQQFEPRLMAVDIAGAIAERSVQHSRNRIFLNTLIEEGKKMLLKAYFLPEVPAKDLMHYNEAEVEWAKAYEAEIWKYFIENELLFSTDMNLRPRFIDEAPFSKFYLDIDKESPGRIGIWMGWQIVKSFMKNNDVTLQELLKTDSETLFNKSKYKPKK